uniref:CUT domain-containing protein n=1 Tax=Heterorhabditis bacteriophora TaxID=37862 RepID=A0A1I7X581_HETBA
MSMSGQYQDQMRHAALDKASFGNGPAGLLSPLHMDRRHASGNTDFGRHVYIKVSIKLITFYVNFATALELFLVFIFKFQRNSSPSPHSFSGPQSASMMQHRIVSYSKLLSSFYIYIHLFIHEILQLAVRIFRSQGTLSDLLRNPKPWNKLKSGRETFRRMFNWVQQPLAMRLGILDMYKSG